MVRSKNSTIRKPVQGERRGTVAVLVATTISVLLGIVAIALDGGLLQDNKRRVQNAADSAAIAARVEIFRRYPTIVSTATYDPEGAALAAARAAAGANGFPHTRSDTTVTVNIPPTTGPFAGKVGCAEVIVTYRQPRYFSAIWGSSATPVTARAVARGYWGATGNGVIVLDPSVSHALDSSGSGSVTITGGGRFVVDSNDSEAARVTGGGSVSAGGFDITGKNPGYTGPLTGGPINTGVPPIPDPLAGLPVPSVPPDGTMTRTQSGSAKTYYLTPGRHTSLPNFGNEDTVILQQGGIYYIDGGGFSSTNGATIRMDPPNVTTGVMVYNKPAGAQQSQGISISGGSVTLSPMTTGPYAGIIFWQERSSGVALNLSGQGGFDIDGTFYAANAQLQVTGQGTNYIGSQYISRTLSLSGGGNTIIRYSDNNTARKREVRLVE